jgi:hypothetical protein
MVATETQIDRKLTLQMALRTVAGLAVVALFLFIPAGRLDYCRAGSTSASAWLSCW